jgi:hypothetical protein
VPRRSVLRLAAPAGALLAALCGAAVWGQTTTVPAPPSGLRPTFDDSGQEAAPNGTTRRRPRQPVSPVGAIPKFGTPPGSGAGRTGFISNPQRKRTPAQGAAKPPGLPPIPPSRTSAQPGRPRTTAALAAPRRTVAASTTAPAAGTGDPAATGAVPTNTAVPTPNTALPAPNAAVPLPAIVTPPPLRRLSVPEDDPFAPVGVRAGTFVLRPALEATTGYDTNPARLALAARGSPQVTLAPELLANSDWERHALDIAIRGAYNYYPDVPLADRPNVDARADGRIDVSRDTRIDVQGRYILSTDYPGSPNIAADYAKLPIYTDVGGTLGVGQRFNRFDVSLKGSFDRIDWDESRLTNGASQSNADRNYDQYAATLRGAYEVSPGLKPFVELNADTRIHDLPIDRTGVDRDSNGLSAKAGTVFEFTRTLTGEISIGYLSRFYVDPALENVHSGLIDAALLWNATALTNVKFVAKTTVDESVLAGVSGVVRHDNGIEISHALRRWLIATAKFGYGIDDYVGSFPFRHDQRYAASLGVIYKLNRDLWAKGEVRQEWLISNIPLANYAATIALVGLRLQR